MKNHFVITKNLLVILLLVFTNCLSIRESTRYITISSEPYDVVEKEHSRENEIICDAKKGHLIVFEVQKINYHKFAKRDQKQYLLTERFWHDNNGMAHFGGGGKINTCLVYPLFPLFFIDFIRASDSRQLVNESTNIIDLGFSRSSEIFPNNEVTIKSGDIVFGKFKNTNRKLASINTSKLLDFCITNKNFIIVAATQNTLSKINLEKQCQYELKNFIQYTNYTKIRDGAIKKILDIPTCKTISACHFLLRDLNRRILSEDDVSVKNAYAKKIEETRNNIVSIKQSNEERRLENQRIAEERAESRRKKMNCMSRQECFEACNMIYSAGYNYIYKRNKCYSDCRRGWYYLPGTSYGRKVCK